MSVIVRAFNKDGYHRDILLMDERQIWMHDARLDDAVIVEGPGMSIDPSKFPEMVRFEVILETRVKR